MFSKFRRIKFKKNNITNCNIFELINNNKFKNLKKINLSDNTIKLENNENQKKYNFSLLKEIDLSNFVFDKNSIHFIEYFNFDDLEIINLSNNNLKIYFLSKI